MKLRTDVTNAPARDPEIRRALTSVFRKEGLLRGRTVVVQELGLRRSDAIIDVAVVNGSLHGYEIKSDADTLRRLARQVEVYGQILDRATLVVGRQHLVAARRMLPRWWGLMVVDAGDRGPSLLTVRRSTENPDRDARALAELLWLDEARELLAARSALRGFRDKPRPAVWDRLCEVYSLDEVAAEVRARLKARAAAGLLRPLS